MSSAADFVVPARFMGPPHSGNGGWTAGHLARLVGDTDGRRGVSVRLSSPPPLDRPMRVEVVDGVTTLLDGDLVVATARPATGPTGDPVPPVGQADAVAAGTAYEGRDEHPFPTCYVCGTQRPDGLQLRPGRVAGGDGEYAAPWRAMVSDVETVWAALDCPGGWSAGIAGRPMVLGTMTAWVDELPAVGADHVIMAWPVGGAGRLFHSGTALYAADGRLLARAEATWVAIDPTAVRPA